MNNETIELANYLEEKMQSPRGNLVEIKETLSISQYIDSPEGYEEDAAEEVSISHWINEAVYYLNKFGDYRAKYVAEQLDRIESDGLNVTIIT